MTIAEIRGKLSSSGSNLSDRREDLLTADVFGCLRYLPFKKGFQKVLTRAQRYANLESLSVKSTNDDVKVRFWPRLEKSEPDVLIQNGTHLIMIEAKYLSGKSGHYGANQDNEDSMEVASSDQLAREFQDLMNYDGDYRKRSLIYLTAHRMLPMEDIKSGHEDLNKLSDDRRYSYKDNIYWLSWFEIYKTVDGLLKGDSQIQDKYWRIVLSDIQHLLHKKGLRQFEGFKGMFEKSSPITSFYKCKLRHIDWNIWAVEPIQQPAFYRKR